jgi:hypothetical protein
MESENLLYGYVFFVFEKLFRLICFERTGFRIRQVGFHRIAINYGIRKLTYGYVFFVFEKPFRFFSHAAPPPRTIPEHYSAGLADVSLIND